MGKKGSDHPGFYCINIVLSVAAKYIFLPLTSMEKQPKQPPQVGPTHFSGRRGKQRLLEAVKIQTIVSGEMGIAHDVIKCGILQQYRKKTVLMRQGEPENDLLLIIAGEVAISVNGRKVATRSAGTHVGDMALADPVARRSATVVAIEPTISLRIPEHQFSKMGKKHPDLWRRVGIELSKRLKERNRVLREPHNEPVLFIGSSTEGLAITTEIHRRFFNKRIVPRPWNDGVFQASYTSIESLFSFAQEADFAALVLTNDDVTKSRGKRNASPRDNVIFELGLFMGTLGRERVFILKPKGLDIKIPSDLLGVTCLEYLKAGKIQKRLDQSCKRMVQVIAKLGPR
jgi:CRP/FNR family cyclic AMP-dependent transcriptional regulator